MPKPLNLVAALALTLAACGGDEEASPPAAATPLQAAMKQAGAMAQETGGAIEPVSPEVLEQRLPGSIEGLQRAEVQRARTGAMGMNMSTMTAEYSGGDGRRVTVAITDLGGLGSAGMMSAAAWAMTDFDRTTDSGYDRTTRFEGFKALESLSRSGGRLDTRFSIIVGERFVVQLEGRDVEMSVLEAAARTLRLRELESDG